MVSNLLLSLLLAACPGDSADGSNAVSTDDITKGVEVSIQRTNRNCINCRPQPQSEPELDLERDAVPPPYIDADVSVAPAPEDNSTTGVLAVVAAGLAGGGYGVYRGVRKQYQS